MLRSKLSVVVGLAILLFGCAEPPPAVDQSAPLFSLLKSSETGITFANSTVEMANRSITQYDYFYNGAGVGIGDINNDGLADVFFAGNDVSNQLFLNKGNFEFEEITKAAGLLSENWSTGVSMVDINQDGYLDIYVCSSGPDLLDERLANKLYVNNGDLTFTERAEEYGIADRSFSSQATFFDMDKDGDLDLFVMNHSLRNLGKATRATWYEALAAQEPEVFKKSCNTLYRNEGNGKFIDITEMAGLLRPGFGLGLVVSDFDENGWPDIYVANDYFIPDFMFFNNGDGTFGENLKGKISHCSYYSMGCDAADFNNDGLVDLAVVDMTPSDHYRNKTLMPSMDVRRFSFLVDEKQYARQYMFNTLNLNRSKGNYSEIGQFAGIAQTDWSWSVLFADLDNNALKDLVVTNGFKRDTKDQDWLRELEAEAQKEGFSDEINFEYLQKAKSTPLTNYIYRNTGDLKFADHSAEWGFTDPSFSHGAAYGDLDNDGDLDMVINNLDKTAFVYRNNTMEKGGSHYIQFELADGGKTAAVLHSKIRIFTGGQTQVVEYSFVRGYLSTMQPLAPTSYLLQNNGGKFADKTESLAPELQKVGMVTAATWSDLDRDGRQDLLVVGEWMPVTVFLNKPEGFENATRAFGMAESAGWWYSIRKGDFDNDGDDDFVVGNLGLNNKFHPSKEKPLHIYATDFDDTGTLDIVLSKVYKGNLVPVRGKECSTQQMPFIAEKMPEFSLFASSTLSDIYGEEKLNAAVHYSVSSFASIYLENKGNNTLEARALPNEAQLAPVNDLVIYDFDRDGNLDVVLGGNMYDTEVETPSYDAGKGLLLKGTGDGNFISFGKMEDTGIFMPQNTKRLALLSIAAEKIPAVLVGNNDHVLQLFVCTF